MTSYGPTALFVLLWSSGALFARWGLDHASPFAFLLMRFLLALAVLLAMRRRWRPAPGTAAAVALTGLLMIGGYSIFYLLALQAGVTPGVLATALGVQPVLTLMWVERRQFAWRRAAGLGLSLAGLVLVVFDSIALSGMAWAGILFALASLACVTVGAILQKRLAQPPMDVLPLQYVVSLGLCALFLPWQPLQANWGPELLLSVVWLGLVISVVATLLLYRLIQAGNLVNVTSLFFLVPAGTAALDWLVLGNQLSAFSLAGMAAIVLGLLLVFRTEAPR